MRPRTPRARLAIVVVGACTRAPAIAGAEVSPPPESPPATSERPGLFQAGPIYLTPRLRIGTIGLDTNVFYTPSERQTDFTASGGPGLDVVLPVRSSLFLTLGGGVDYLYFARTTSQRRLAGDGRARLAWIGPGASAGLEGSYRRSFSRPNFEVDRRLAQTEEQARGDVRLKVGQRLELRAEGAATRTEVDAGQQFLGADLRRALSRDTYLGRLTTAYRLTPKTSLFIEADHQADRFLLERGRDADSNRLGGGFEVRSTTRLAGRAVAGVRSFRLRDPPTAANGAQAGSALEPYAAVDLIYHFGPRTRLVGFYTRDLHYSAFEPLGGRPTVRIESWRARLEKGLVGNLDLWLFGGLTRLVSEGPLVLQARTGEPLVAQRDDTAYEAGADLGYVIRRHLRIGVAASYTERRSSVADFSLEGLLVGGTITFKP